MVECATCKGKGTVKPLLYEYSCNSCSGSGVVDAITGKQIPEDVLIPAMKSSIRDLKRRLFILQEQLKGCECNSRNEPMRKRFNGVHRMD